MFVETAVKEVIRESGLQSESSKPDGLPRSKIVGSKEVIRESGLQLESGEPDGLPRSKIVGSMEEAEQSVCAGGTGKTGTGKRTEDIWLNELRNVMGDDVPVYLCGRPSSLREVAVRQVRERGYNTYMADIVRDDEGHIKRVSYDRIRFAAPGERMADD